MPAIQDVYSINVSNRFALAIDNEIDEGNESDNYGDFDPLDQLRLLEEQKKKDRLPKKKNKVQTQQEHEKSVPKKELQFKENKDSNVPTHNKRSSDKRDVKEEKSKSKKEFTSKDFSGKSKGNDRAPPGDENRRPRRQNNQRPEKPRERGGDGDQFNKPFDDPSERSNKRGPMNAVGEGRMDRRDRGGGRYERFRGNRGGFGGPRGGFGYRNNYRSDGRDDRGKREFDRRSGSDKSGVKPSDKRDGGGARNWGTPGNEFEETVENTTFESEEAGTWGDQPETNQQTEDKQDRPAATGEGEEKKEDDAPADAEEPDEDAAPAEMTLDEWRAMHNSAGKKKQFNIRKPGEGEESGKWTNMKVIHESTGNKPVLHHVVTDDNLRSTTTKPVIDVNIRFDMPPRSSGGRGGRGGRGRGGRGGGFRGGQRGGGGGRYGNRYGSQNPPPPDVLNEKEFPTLPAA